MSLGWNVICSYYDGGGGVRGSLMVRMLHCQSRGRGFEISTPPVPSNQVGYNEYTDCTPTVGR